MTRAKLSTRWGIGVLSFLPLLAAAQASEPWPGWSGPGPWHMMWGGGWGFWWIMPLMMFALMILCVFMMMRGPWGHRDPHADSTASAMRILNERFAQGLISKDEFEEKKATLARRA